MTIKLTKEHIKKGIKGSCENCVIALALKEAGFPNAVVGVDHYRLDSTTLKFRLTTSQMREIIFRFDGERNVSPTTIEIPDDDS